MAADPNVSEPSLEAIILGRHSVRAFDPARAVPLAVVHKALELAQWAPSNCNAQPWRTYVAAGEVCARLRARLVAAVEQGLPVEEQATPAFTGRYRELQVACAVELYQKLNIARHDVAARARAQTRNFEFFDAPHVAVLCMDQSFGVPVALDVGAYLQTFMLALHALGVGSCAQASLRCYASILREELGIAQELRILCGVSFGYAMPGAEVNQVRQTRGTLQDNVVFAGWPGTD